VVSSEEANKARAQLGNQKKTQKKDTCERGYKVRKVKAYE
jgi:hypothetical protein